MRINHNPNRLSRSLTIAVLGLAALPMIIAAIAGWNQRAVVAPIDAMSGVHTQLYSDYREVITSAYELERALRQIGDRNEPEIAARLADSITAHQRAVRHIVEQPDSRFVDGELASQLQAAFVMVEQDVAEITGLIDQMTARRSLIESQVDSIRATNAQLLAANSASLRSGGPTRDAPPNMMLYWSEQLTRLAGTTSDAEKREDLRTLQANYQKAMRSAVFELSLSPAGPKRVNAAAKLDALFELAMGQSGLFSLQDLRITDSLQLLELQDQASRHIQSMVVASEEIARQSTEATKELLSAANNSLQTSKNALIVSAALAFLISMFVVRVQIQRRLVTRLHRLRDETQKLADGDLHAPITEDDHDEIGELQRALHVFQRTALTLEQREQLLIQKTQRLKTANKGLDDFAYVASHDLRAPLRSIDNLATFIGEDLGDDVPAETRRHLDLMRKRIARLESLLVGLLEYSRVGREDAEIIEVNMGELVKESADVSRKDGFKIVRDGEFPTVKTQASVVQDLVANLIGNAIKHHDKDRGQITLTCQQRGRYCELHVEDDGPGIDPKYHKRVFDLFQTLKARDQLEGNGMGLALIKKSAESLGGSILLDSNPAERRGSIFTLRWPVLGRETAGDNDVIEQDSALA